MVDIIFLFETMPGVFTKKVAILETPGACIIKPITAGIYGFRNKLVFVPGKPFQPSLVFKDKH